MGETANGSLNTPARCLVRLVRIPWPHRGQRNSPRISSLFFIDFLSEASTDRGRIVCAKPTAPVFMISHMDGLEAQISSIFRRFQRKEICFNCLRSIGSPVFLLWKCLISGERCIFSRIVTYFKERKVSRFLFVISTASLYAVENDYVFGPTHLPYERS